MGRIFPCSIGRGGIGEKLGEGDGVTPIGSFELLAIYSRPDRTQPLGSPIGLTYIWSDDPKDQNYNSLQTCSPYPYGHEKMRRSDCLYNVIGDVSFNRTPPVPGKGSAIFLHVWRAPRYPTEGCIAFDQRDLTYILERWTDKSRIIVR